MVPVGMDAVMFEEPSSGSNTTTCFWLSWPSSMHGSSSSCGCMCHPRYFAYIAYIACADTVHVRMYPCAKLPTQHQCSERITCRKGDRVNRLLPLVYQYMSIRLLLFSFKRFKALTCLTLLAMTPTALLDARQFLMTSLATQKLKE